MAGAEYVFASKAGWKANALSCAGGGGTAAVGPKPISDDVLDRWPGEAEEPERLRDPSSAVASEEVPMEV